MYLQFKDDRILILEDDLLAIDGDELFLNEKGHWITVHPNGEDSEGRHLFIRDGESIEQALDRQWGKSSKKKQAEEEEKRRQEEVQRRHEELERQFKEAAAKAKAERLDRVKRGEYFEELNDDGSNIKAVRDSFKQFTGIHIGRCNKDHVKWVLNTFKTLHNRFPSLLTSGGNSKLRGVVKTIKSDLAYRKEHNAYAYNQRFMRTIGICVDTRYANEQIYHDVKSGFHPQGTSEIESILVHEIGHGLALGLSEVGIVNAVKRKYGANCASNISRYATESDAEFLAEAFTDYVYNKQKAKPESILAMEEWAKQSKIIAGMLK